MLEAFNKRSHNLQKMLVADSSQLFENLSSIANEHVIGNKQQEFLSEIKGLADSLRNTVLDSSGQKSVDKMDKKTRAFLQDVINKALNAEKLKLEKQQKSDLEETIHNQMDAKLASVEQQVDSQLSLSKLVEKTHPEQSVYSESQVDAGIIENQDKAEIEKFKRKTIVEQQNIDKFDELKKSTDKKDDVVYSFNKSLDEVENRLAKYEQELIKNDSQHIESKTKAKKQQVHHINTNNIAERNAQSFKSLKELVADK